MKVSRVYMDACCLIEAIKGRLERTTDHDPHEIDMIQRVLRAGRNGDLDVFTSILSVAEVLYLEKDEKPPSDETKDYIERFLMSGKDGIKLVSVYPDTATIARDLAWKHGIYKRSIDTMHVASAMQCGASELFTLDDRLARKIGTAKLGNCRIISASKTELLPVEYRTDDLFEESAGG